MDVTSIVKVLLVKYPETQDNPGLLSQRFLYEFSGMDPVEFIASNIQDTINRKRRLIQKQNPELRGTKYQARQKHAKLYAAKLRSQEKPEIVDVSAIFQEEPKTFFEKLFSFVK